LSQADDLPAGWSCEVDKIVYDPLPEEDTACCCKDGSCSMDSLQRGDTRQVFLAGGQPKCCKIVKLDKFAKAWGTCPVDPGDLILPDKFSKDFCLESKAVPSEANCTLAISSWMRHQDWYRGVKHWERYEAAYDAYIMCMVPLPDHLGVMLDERGVLEAGEPNSILRFIRELDMCAGLPDAVIKSSVLSSYEDVCPFGLPREGYTPEFDPSLTCSFHSDTHQIFLNDGASCPEGHRCACPVYSELSALKEAAEAGNEGVSQVQTVIDTASATASAAVSAGLVAPKSLQVPTAMQSASVVREPSEQEACCAAL